MHFDFNEEQRLLQRSARDLFDQYCRADHVRAAWSHSEACVPGLWQRLSELGIVGLSVPERFGGSGLAELELVLVLEEAGRAAVPEPLTGTIAVGTPLVAELGGALAERWLPEVAAGRAVLSVALMPWAYVPQARAAALLLLERDGAVYAVEPARVELFEQPSVDGSRRLFRVRFEPRADDVVAEGATARYALAAARDRGAFALAAELIGLGARLLEISVEYAKTRQQFGRPIGSFQAIKHQLAEALIALELARPLVYRAAWSLARRDSQRSLHASMAKASAADAASFIARVALQVHGAIGYSFEYDLHLYMKRVWALASCWGDALWHRELCAKRMLDKVEATGGVS